jgi:hypothetical protein
MFSREMFVNILSEVKRVHEALSKVDILQNIPIDDLNIKPKVNVNITKSLHIKYNSISKIFVSYQYDFLCLFYQDFNKIVVNKFFFSFYIFL